MKTQKACVSCNRRKQKCNRESPCSRCISLKVTCTYVSYSKPSPVKRFSELDISINRIRAKEAKLTDTFKDFERLTNDSAASTSDSTVTSSLSQSAKEYSPLLSRAVSFSTSDKLVCSVQKSRNQIFETYFSLISKVHVFIKEDRARKLLFVKNPEDEVLVNAILAFSLPLYNYVNSLPSIKTEDNFYYKRTNSLCTDPNLPYNIDLVQALVILTQIELNEGQFLRSSLLLAKAIRICQTLGFHKIEYGSTRYSMEPLEYESFKAWCVCLTLDRFVSMFFRKPPIINFDPKEVALPQPKGNSLHFDLFNYMLLPHCELDVATLFVFTVELYYEFSQLKEKLVNIDEGIRLSARFKEMFGQLQQLEKFPIVTSDFDTLFREDVDLLTNTIYPAVISYNLFRFSLLCSMFHYFHQLLENAPETDYPLSVELLNEARKYGLLIFKISAKMQKKYEAIFSSKLDILFYLLELGHTYNIDVAQIAFKSDTSKSTQKLISSFKEIIKSVSEIWPLLCFDEQYAE